MEARQLPEHYRWQVQHQPMVTKADVADVFVFDGGEGIVFRVASQLRTWPQIHEAWEKFGGFVTTRSPPPLVNADVRERDDAEWIAAASAYVDAKQVLESWRPRDESNVRPAP